MEEPKPLKDIGKRMRLVRADRGISQAELADRTGCTESTIWGIESGRSMPSLGRALSIAEALDVTLDYLVRGEQ